MDSRTVKLLSALSASMEIFNMPVQPLHQGFRNQLMPSRIRMPGIGQNKILASQAVLRQVTCPVVVHGNPFAIQV